MRWFSKGRTINVVEEARDWTGLMMSGKVGVTQDRHMLWQKRESTFGFLESGALIANVLPVASRPGGEQKQV